mgnify:CR=1 FL=1
MELQTKFGKAVRQFRTASGLTIEALAQDAGISYSYLGEIERGMRNPSLAVIAALAGSLRVEPYRLLMD